MNVNLRNVNIYNSTAQEFYKGSMAFENGRICEIQLEEGLCDGAYIIPGMIDVHTHGRKGFDFPYLNEDEYRMVLRSYAEAGTTTVMPTVGSYPVSDVESWIGLTKKIYKSGSDCCTANIGGIHLEGRYINPLRKGAHMPSMLAPLNADELTHTLKSAEPMPVHVTYAPELEGAAEFAKAIADNGATAGIGHSDATYEQAANSGVVSYTHLFNAMRPIHHREPGTVGAGLLSDAYTELICDGIHLHPAVVKLAYRLKGTEKIILITDSGLATGLGDGEYSKGGNPVYVKNGKVVTADGTIAGSTLNLFDGLKNFASFCGLTLEQALPCATVNPAVMIGIQNETGSLEIGKRADFIVLDRDKSTIKNVYCNGTALNKI